MPPRRTGAAALLLLLLFVSASHAVVICKDFEYGPGYIHPAQYGERQYVYSHLDWLVPPPIDISPKGALAQLSYADFEASYPWARDLLKTYSTPMSYTLTVVKLDPPGEVDNCQTRVDAINMYWSLEPTGYMLTSYPIRCNDANTKLMFSVDPAANPSKDVWGDKLQWPTNGKHFVPRGGRDSFESMMSRIKQTNADTIPFCLVYFTGAEPHLELLSTRSCVDIDVTGLSNALLTQYNETVLEIQRSSDRKKRSTDTEPPLPDPNDEKANDLWALEQLRKEGIPVDLPRIGKLAPPPVTSPPRPPSPYEEEVIDPDAVIQPGQQIAAAEDVASVQGSQDALVAAIDGRIWPVLQCIKAVGDGTCIAHFAYVLASESSVSIPVKEEDNWFEPVEFLTDFQLPTTFSPGRHSNAFVIRWFCVGDTMGSWNAIYWTLKDATATALSSSPRCDETEQDEEMLSEVAMGIEKARNNPAIRKLFGLEGKARNEEEDDCDGGRDDDGGGGDDDGGNEDDEDRGDDDNNDDDDDDGGNHHPPTSAPPLPSPKPTVTVTPKPTVTVTPVPTVTVTPKPTVTVTPKPTVTVTPTPTITTTPKPTVTVTPTPTPTVTATPVPTVTATPKPTVTVTPVPTVTPTPTVAATPSPTVTQTPTPTDGPLQPYLECTHNFENGTCVSYWGFLNPNNQTIFRAPGFVTNNYFVPGDVDRGQPGAFMSGRHYYILTTSWPCPVSSAVTPSNFSWVLDTTATASSAVHNTCSVGCDDVPFSGITTCPPLSSSTGLPSSSSYSSMATSSTGSLPTTIPPPPLSTPPSLLSSSYASSTGSLTSSSGYSVTSTGPSTFSPSPPPQTCSFGASLTLYRDRGFSILYKPPKHSVNVEALTQPYGVVRMDVPDDSLSEFCLDVTEVLECICNNTVTCHPFDAQFPGITGCNSPGIQKRVLYRKSPAVTNDGFSFVTDPPTYCSGERAFTWIQQLVAPPGSKLLVQATWSYSTLADAEQNCTGNSMGGSCITFSCCGCPNTHSWNSSSSCCQPIVVNSNNNNNSNVNNINVTVINLISITTNVNITIPDQGTAAAITGFAAATASVAIATATAAATSTTGAATASVAMATVSAATAASSTTTAGSIIIRDKDNNGKWWIWLLVGLSACLLPFLLGGLMIACCCCCCAAATVPEYEMECVEECPPPQEPVLSDDIVICHAHQQEYQQHQMILIPNNNRVAGYQIYVTE